MAIVPKIILVLLAVPVAILAWMNLTPGHFQNSNCCGCHSPENTVEYLPTNYTAENCGGIFCVMSICKPKTTDLIKLSLSKLDFNK